MLDGKFFLLVSMLLLLSIPHPIHAQSAHGIGDGMVQLYIPFDFYAEGSISLTGQNKTEQLEVLIFSGAGQGASLGAKVGPGVSAKADTGTGPGMSAGLNPAASSASNPAVRPGTDRYLAIIKAPPGKRGISCLKKEKDWYLYYPGSDSFITPDNSTQDNPCLPFMYPHFNRQGLAGYTVISEKQAQLGIYNCLLLELEARSGQGQPVFARLWINSPEQLLLRAEYFTGSTQYITTVNYLEYAAVDGCPVPVKWQVYKNTPSPFFMTVTIKTLTKTKLPEFIFTRAFLQLLSGN